MRHLDEPPGQRGEHFTEIFILDFLANLKEIKGKHRSDGAI